MSPDNEENKIEDEILEDEIFEDELIGDEVTELPPVVPVVEEDVKVATDGRKFSELSNFEKIKFASAQNGVAVLEPKKDCKHCYATGIVSTRTIKTLTSPPSATEKEYLTEVLPNPCRCIFRKEDLHKMFTGRHSISRADERYHEKKEKRVKHKKSFEMMVQKQNRDRKKRLKKKRAKRAKR